MHPHFRFAAPASIHHTRTNRSVEQPFPKHVPAVTRPGKRSKRINNDSDDGTSDEHGPASCVSAVISSSHPADGCAPDPLLRDDFQKPRTALSSRPERGSLLKMEQTKVVAAGVTPSRLNKHPEAKIARMDPSRIPRRAVMRGASDKRAGTRANPGRGFRIGRSSPRSSIGERGNRNTQCRLCG